MMNLAALAAASLALAPGMARAEAFDLNCTALNAQNQPEGRSSRYHIDRSERRWCGGACSPINAITGDDGTTLTLGGPAVGAGLNARTTYNLESKVFLVELGQGENVHRTSLQCEVAPFSGFTADHTAGPRPQNMSVLLSIRPPATADGKSLSGRVGIELAVDEQGRITGCSATKSSGTVELDRYACEQASKRLTMKPATDGAGKPVAGSFRTNIAFAGG